MLTERFRMSFKDRKNDNLQKAPKSRMEFGLRISFERTGRTIWIVDAHGTESVLLCEQKKP